MCEVTSTNFEELYSSIEDAFKCAVFISVDCEFSMLNNEDGQSSLFDTPEERYIKMKNNLENAVPMEIGLTAFHFDRNNMVFSAQPYKFFVFPTNFPFVSKSFTCSASSFIFLSEHNFDFNKFVYSGIPYLNMKQEEELQNHINKGDLYEYCLSHLDRYLLDRLQELCTKVSQWFHSKCEEDFIQPQFEKKKSFLLYVVQKNLLSRFPRKIWIYTEEDKLIIKKVTEEEYLNLSKNVSFEKHLMFRILGFSRIFKLLVSLQKPIVGHNCVNDILLLINTFHSKLPSSYRTFKEIVKQLFPSIYDTKHISFEIWKYVQQSTEWKSNGLEDLYDFFKNEIGRHMISGSPPIEIVPAFRNYTTNMFHDAGWDAYATGYCFIRMMHIIAAKTYESHSKKNFLATEYMNAMEHLKNRVNLIRAATAYMNLGGPDPKSERPPCFIIKSLTSQPIDIMKVTELLAEYGSIEIKPYSSHGRTAIAVFGNHSSARRIVATFKNCQDFQIVLYNPIAHSAYVRAALWGGILSSTAVLLCLVHHYLK